MLTNEEQQEVLDNNKDAIDEIISILLPNPLLLQLEKEDPFWRLGSVEDLEILASMVPGSDQQLLSSAHLAFNMTQNQDMGVQEATYPAGPLMPNKSTSLADSGLANMNGLNIGSIRTHDHIYDGSGAQEAACPAGPLVPSSSGLGIANGFHASPLQGELYQQSHIDHTYDGSRGMEAAWPTGLPDSQNYLANSLLTDCLQEGSYTQSLLEYSISSEDTLLSGELGEDLTKLFPDLEIDITSSRTNNDLMSYNNFTDLDSDSSPLFEEYSITSESELNRMPLIAAPVKTIEADRRPALHADSSLHKVISTVPKVQPIGRKNLDIPKVISTVQRVQPIGRKKIDMAAQRYVTSSTSDDDSDVSEDSDSIDVETVEGEASLLESSSDLELNPVYINSHKGDPQVSPLLQIKNEVDNKKNSRSNKENNVSSPVERSLPPSGTFTTHSAAQKPPDHAKQLNNKLDEPSETAKQPTASTRKLSNTDSPNPLRTVRRQPTASVNKSKTTNPIILLEPPEIDPASKKGRRSRNYKNTISNNNNEPTKKKTPERRKRKESDKTRPSTVKSSPPSSIQEESTARSQRIPTPPSGIGSSQNTSHSTPATQKLTLSDIPDFLPIESSGSNRIPAAKPKRPDRKPSIRSANISTVNGDKQTILVLDNVTGNEPVKNVGTVKVITSAKPMESLKTGTASTRSIAHDHSYHSPTKQPLVNQLDKLTANISHSHTPQRTKTIVAATLAQPVVNQLDHLTTTTVSQSSTPQRASKSVASTSTQSDERAATVYTLNEFNTKYKMNLRINELIVNDANGVPKKKLTLGDYLKRKKTMPQIHAKPPQTAKMSNVQAARSHQEMLSGILATKQQENAVEEPNRIRLPPILPVQKVVEVRVRTIKPLPNFITVETFNKSTNTDTKLDDRLIAALHRSSEPEKLLGNKNSLFNELLANSIETAKTPVVASTNDNFEPPTIRHLDKEEVSRIQTRSVEVQTDVHLDTSNVFSSSSSVRSLSPTLSHHSPPLNHSASNSSSSGFRSSRSYTPSPEILRSESEIGGCSPVSNSSSTHSSRSRYSSYTKVKRKREHEQDDDDDAEGRRVMFLGGLTECQTVAELQKRFEKYDPSEIKIYTRKYRPGKYAFLTFADNATCIEAIEDASAVPSVAYEISFGGRRKFCDGLYVDFDQEYSSVESSSQRKRRISFTDELNSYAKLRKMKEKKT